MGTSVAHRSPKGWAKFRREFQRSPVDPTRVVAAAAQCLNERWADRFGSPAVAEGLESWISRVYRRNPPRGWTATDLCRAIQMEARQRAARVVGPGMAAELALRAAHGALTELVADGAGEFQPDRPAREVVDAARKLGLDALVSLFVGHYVAALFGYLVSRDSSEFVGRRGMPDLAVRASILSAVQALSAGAVGPGDVAEVVRALGEAEQVRGDRLRRTGSPAGEWRAPARTPMRRPGAGAPTWPGAYPVCLALAVLWPVLLGRLRRAQ